MRTPMKMTMTSLVILVLLLAAAGCAKRPNPARLTTELLPVPGNPLIHVRVVLKLGSGHDPAGKEGLCQLTLSLLSEGGTKDLTFQEITRKFYPMAAQVHLSVDKEMSALAGTIHLDNLDKFYAIFRDMLLAPGFREDDFNRLKTNQLNHLEKTLVSNMDEQFGKEILNLALYQDHPYGHHDSGTIESLRGLTLDDIKGFYAEHFVQGNVILGLAGGYPQDFPARVRADFAKLPEGFTPRLVLPAPKMPNGLEVVIADKQTPATAISMGFPVSLTRADDDFFALWMAGAHFGEHRQHLSHLFQKIREERGQNYGDYAYIEHFIQGRDKFPATNYCRQQQYFSIWIRPLANSNRHFVVRQALRELRMLVEEGLPEDRFELVRTYLLNYTKLYTQTLGERLGWQLDSRYYGYEDFLAEVQERLLKITREDVNAAIKKYLNWQNVRIVIITQDGQALKDDLVANTPSPVTYANPSMPQAVLDEDLVIQVYALDVRPENVRVAPASSFFQKAGIPTE